MRFFFFYLGSRCYALLTCICISSYCSIFNLLHFVPFCKLRWESRFRGISVSDFSLPWLGIVLLECWRVAFISIATLHCLKCIIFGHTFEDWVAWFSKRRVFRLDGVLYHSTCKCHIFRSRVWASYSFPVKLFRFSLTRLRVVLSHRESVTFRSHVEGRIASLWNSVTFRSQVWGSCYFTVKVSHFSSERWTEDYLATLGMCKHIIRPWM